MSEKYHNYQLLLAKAAQLCEKHGVGRPEPLQTNFREGIYGCLEDSY